MITNLSGQVSEFFLEEEGRSEKKFKKSKHSVFQLAFQKQGLKQLYHPLRKVVIRCTTIKKDWGR